MFAAAIVLFVITFILASTRFWKFGCAALLLAMLLGLTSVIVAAWRLLP